MSRSISAAGLAVLVATFGGCSDKGGRTYPGPCELAVDNGEDGVIDSLEVRTYDDHDNLLTVDLDSDNDGVVDVSRGYTYTYHGNGGVASTREDANGDGVWETEYQYNESGQMVLLGWDDDGDGVADRGYRFTYGPSDQLQTEAFYDAWPFDSVVWDKTYQYDSDGYLIEIESFNHVQQQVTAIETHTWNANHTVEDMALDRNDDGIIDASYHSEYDLDGNQILHEPDWDGDGLADYIATTTYADGLTVESTLDEDADGVVDSRTTYTYDAHGRLIETSIDSPVDGTADQSTTWSYDKSGNALTARWHDASDITLTTYDYACW